MNKIADNKAAARVKIQCFTVSPSAIRALREAATGKAYNAFAQAADIAALYLGRDGREITAEEARAAIDGADFIILDLMGASKEIQDEIGAACAEKADTPTVVVNTDIATIRGMGRLGSFSMGAMSRGKNSPKSKEQGGEEGRVAEIDASKMIKMVRAMEKIGETIPIGPLRDVRNYLWISSSWRYATKRNAETMLSLMGGYLGVAGLPRPQKPEAPLCPVLVDEPGGAVFDTIDELARARGDDPSRGKVALLFAAGTYPIDTSGAVAAIVRRLNESCCVFPVAAMSGGEGNEEFLLGLLYDETLKTCRVDCVASLLPFRFGQGPMGGDSEAARRLFKKLNVPFLHPFFMNRKTVCEWEADPRGLESGEFMLHYFLPELDGASGMLPLGASLGFELRGKTAPRAAEPQATTSAAPVRITKAADNVSSDDPTGTIATLDDRIHRFADRISAVARLRRTPADQRKIAILVYDYPPGAANAGSAAFLDSFSSVAAILSAMKRSGYAVEELSAREIRERCVEGGMCAAAAPGEGKPHASIDAATYSRYAARLPGAAGIDRAWGPFPGTVMTHGREILVPRLAAGNATILFQPARTDDAVMSPEKYHDNYLPPHHQYAAVYRWIEESLGAHAIVHIGTHGTLEFLPGKELAPSGHCFPDQLIGALPHAYCYYAGNPSEAMIAKRKANAVLVGYLQPPYEESGLPEGLVDIAAMRDEYERTKIAAPDRSEEVLSELKDRVIRSGFPWEGVDSLDERLYEIKKSLIPIGHHVLGSSYSHDEALRFIAEFLKEKRPGYPSPYHDEAASKGFDYDALRAAAPPDEAALAGIEHAAMARIKIAAQGWCRQAPRSLDGTRGFRENESHNAIGDNDGCRAIYDGLVRDGEIEGLLNILAGGYADVGLGGDPYRSEGVIPTGRNLHQFDPRRTPTPSALRRGRALAEAALQEHFKRTARYPERVALVLWGLETSKTEGETVAQILSYLGVRIAWGRNLWDTRLELIPLEELGRPRIDVLIQISGFFRDLFPNLVELLNDAVELAASAEEPVSENSVRAEAFRILESLAAKGMSEDDAKDRAYSRLFGPPPGIYGTGLTKMVHSSSWRDESEIVEEYERSMCHSYSKKRYGEADPQLLGHFMSRVEVVSQTRASRDYEMGDLDHFYEHFGGLSRAIEERSGKRAMQLVSDSYDGKPRVETVEKAIQRGAQTRLLNKKWLDGILATDFRGGQEVADRLENLLGLAATTKAVDEALFESAANTLLLDDEMRERLEKNNPYALLESADRLLEIASRGYWSCDEKTLERIEKIRDELEDMLE